MFSFYQSLMSCLLICLPFISVGQVDYGRDFSKKIPPRLQFDQIELRDQTLQRMPEELRTGPFKRDCFRFAELETEKTISNLEGGSIYSDWLELEDYLNAIMRKIMPDSLKKDSTIHIYPKRGSYVGSPNMDFTGKIFLDISLVSEVKDEATLAGFIAMTLVDFYIRDEFSSFLEEQVEVFNRSFIEENEILLKGSEKKKMKSAKIAMKWLSNAGYDVGAYKEVWRVIIQNNNNSIKKSGVYLALNGYITDKDFLDLTGVIDEFIAQKENEEGKSFLVSEKDFYRYSKSAKSEALKFLLSHHYYKACLERAFKFHIFDVENATYIYYIMEAIRRSCYIEPTLWNKLFIVNNYYVYDGDNPSGTGSFLMREHLFKNIPHKVLRLNPAEIAEKDKFEGHFYWKDLKFTTYKEAFLFFYQVSDVLKIPECSLSFALGQKKPNVRKQLIKKYLTYENTKYKDYAEKLFEGNINDSLKNKKLLVLIDFDFYAMQAKEQVFVHDRSENKIETQQLLGDIVSGLENRTVLFAPQIKTTNLEEYNALMSLFFLTRNLSIRDFNWNDIKNGAAPLVQLEILSPELRSFIEKYGVNSIEFLYCKYSEKGRRKTSIEAYEEVSNMGVINFLKRKNKSKSLYLMITGFEIKDESFETMVFHDDVSLKYKGTAHSYIINHLKEQFYKKDEAMAKKEAKNKKK